MKKIAFIMTNLFLSVLLIACQSGDDLSNDKTYTREAVELTFEVTTGANLNETQDGFTGGGRQQITTTFLSNPSRVALFTFDILDILDLAGVENTSITRLGFPKNDLPSYLLGYQTNSYRNVGTLFMPSFDDLDLFLPELIIIGGRSASAYDLLKIHYPDADILDVTLVDGAYLTSVTRNVENLKLLFPSITDALNANLTTITSNFTHFNTLIDALDAMLIMVNGNSLSTYGSLSRFSVLYNEFGFIPSDTQMESTQSHGELISYEYIRQINPSVIFIIDRGLAIGNESNSEEVYKNALIKQTKAGLNNQIYELDGTAWYLSMGGFQSTEKMFSDLQQLIDYISE